MRIIATSLSALTDTLMQQKWLSFVFILTCLSLFFYSFTQVDLSLTLARSSVVQDFQKAFQYVGYFNRPLSSWLFVALVVLMTAFYFLCQREVKKGSLKRRHVWTFITLMAGLLAFSYNAFSYDLFNYIFDAKILTHYFQNPYLHKALDFPADPMLSFMRWTHRVYPYGPVWLGISVPFSAAGMGYFLPTFFLFKVGIAASFIGMMYFFEKIADKVDPSKSLLLLTLVAFHPLMIIENLVSSHNDSVMMFFAFFAVFLLLSQRFALSSAMFILSVGIKFATVFLFPSVLFYWYGSRKKYTHLYEQFFLFSGILLLFAAVAATARSDFQPWYLTWALPFFLMLPGKKYLAASQVISTFSLLSLFLYIPYLFYGNWDNKVPSELLLIFWSVIAVLYALVFVYTLIRRN